MMDRLATRVTLTELATTIRMTKAWCALAILLMILVGGFNSYKFAEWLVGQIAAGNELRVKYVISNKKIASGPNQGKPVGVWRTYTGANPHKDHVHVSVRNIPKLYDDKSPWGWA